jgi:hypothetical protein
MASRGIARLSMIDRFGWTSFQQLAWNRAVPAGDAPVNQNMPARNEYHVTGAIQYFEDAVLDVLGQLRRASFPRPQEIPPLERDWREDTSTMCRPPRARVTT